MHFSTIVAVVPLFAAVPGYGYDTTFGVKTFDAEEYFKKSQNLEVTTYRACPSVPGPNGNFHSNPGCPTTAYGSSVVPIPQKSAYGGTDSNTYIDWYYDWYTPLKWQGGNPDYPILVGLQSYFEGIRLEYEFPSNTARINVESSFLPSANQTLPVGVRSTEKLRYEVLSNYLMSQSETGYLVWTVGQPKDPKWKDDKESDGGRILSKGTPFMVSGASVHVRNAFELRRQDNEATLQKWKLGVGLGVGLGVPVLMIACFYAGRLMEGGTLRPKKDMELDDIPTTGGPDPTTGRY